MEKKTMYMGATIAVIGIMVLAAVMAGWVGNTGSNNNSDNGTGSTIILRTTGATFPQYQVQKWIDTYQKSNPNVKIEYEGGGSGHGQDAFMQGLSEIGRTDPPVSESTWSKFEDTGDMPLQFPEVVGAVVISYNIPGVGDIKLSQDALVGIFIGDIEYWDGAKITGQNPGINLPHEKIIVVHRSDSSGTTAIFTTYLSVINSTWDKQVGAGKTVQWPTDDMGRGLGGKGNPGVVSTLKQTDYSICYTELSFAIEESLPTAYLENADGNYTEPTDSSIQAAVAGVSSNIPPPDKGYSENLKQLLNAQGNDSYPIVAFTHMLVWKNIDGKHYTHDDVTAIKDFMKWVLTDGQKPENLAPGYVGLPEDVANIGLSAINQIQG